MHFYSFVALNYINTHYLDIEHNQCVEKISAQTNNISL